MSEEQQRIKILVSMGWKPCPKSGCWHHWTNPSGEEATAPDPVRDLNAMREAEATLSPHARNEFIAHLWKVTGNEPSVNFWTEYNFRGLYACIHATASQRAEAFLKTLNLWEESA